MFYRLNKNKKWKQVHCRDNHSLDFCHKKIMKLLVLFPYQEEPGLLARQNIIKKKAPVLVIFPSHLFMYLLKASLIIGY